jgi:hypothetical protein
MEALIVFSIITLLVLSMFIFSKWFPYTKGILKDGKDIFRIKEKQKGTLVYYRAEVYRPVLGWTPFWASEINGIITYDASFTKYKSYCEQQINLYKQLKSK